MKKPELQGSGALLRSPHSTNTLPTLILWLDRKGGARRRSTRASSMTWIDGMVGALDGDEWRAGAETLQGTL